jgi:hypothetical protein
MELQQYKANRSAEIKAKYISLLNGVVNKYNRMIANVLNSRFILFKQFELWSIRTAYVIEYQRILKQFNDETARIIMPAPINYANASKKALLIGINYIGALDELKGCINDVDNISNILTGYKSIVKLTDNTDIKPTRNNILSELRKLLENSVAGDILILSFSGHGSQTIDIGNDELDGKDEFIYAIDNKIIKDDEINAYIKTYLKPNVTFFAIFDSCHSGTMMDLKYNYMDYIENPNNTDTMGNVIMISGCRDDQTSADGFINSESQGAMTWSLLNSIKPNITWRQLITNMKDSLEASNYKQTPKLSSGKIIDLDSKFIFG